MRSAMTILLRADLQGWANGFRYGRDAWRRVVLKGLGYLVCIIALSLVGHSLFTQLRVTTADTAPLRNVINGFLLFAMIVVAKELMERSLKTLYEAPDTAVLHAAPIRTAVIFGYKFIRLVGTGFLSLLCFLGPPWIAFGLIFDLPWFFYLGLFPVCVSLLVLVTSYVTISVMVMARFFSSGWLLTTLKLLGTGIGVTVGFLLSLALFFEAEPIQIRQMLLNWATNTEAGTTRLWSPHAWIGQFLLSWVTESAPGSRWRWMLSGLGGSLAATGIAAGIAHLIYQRGWENIRQLRTGRKSGRGDAHSHRAKTTAPLTQLRHRFGRGKLGAMMLKDLLIFVRHSGRASAMVMLTLFLVVHIGILFLGDDTDSNAGYILTVQIVLYSMFITYGLSCNGLRDEAKTWWLLQTAPVTPKLVFAGKFLTALCCGVIYAEFWSVFAAVLLRLPLQSVIPLLLVPVLTLPTACAVNTAIGTFPWMAELTQQPKPLSRVLTFIGVLILNLGFVLIPVIVWNVANLFVSLGAALLLIGVFVAAYRWGISNLRRLLAVQT